MVNQSLRLKTKRNGKKANDDKTPVWCYYEYKAENGIKYGKLYNWYAVSDVRGLAPKGYEIPDSADWNQLIKYCGGIMVAGKKTKKYFRLVKQRKCNSSKWF